MTITVLLVISLKANVLFVRHSLNSAEPTLRKWPVWFWHC